MTAAGPRRVSRRLGAEIEKLDEKQRRAVMHRGSTVVTAGPGSGKTRTLVAKVGLLLQADVPPSQGVACLTYTNQAALEVSRRLARLGVHESTRLTCATVHSWCLNQILRRYRALHGDELREPLEFCSEDKFTAIVERCLRNSGADYRYAEYEKPLITTIRRRLAAGVDVSGFDDKKVAAARAYDKVLLEYGLVDFDAMVARSLYALLIRCHRRRVRTSARPGGVRGSRRRPRPARCGRRAATRSRRMR